jgi:lysyl-tRNA synthetase class 2
MIDLWKPTAKINVLRQRAAIIRSIRNFFYERDVLEVETPSLSANTVTDPYLTAMSTLHTEPGASVSKKLYLQTSPEFAMKRLLAAGSGDIFQICKSYRDDEVGRLHNPEFTMLEWYRVDFEMQALIDEVTALLVSVLPVTAVEQFSYC